MKAQSGLDYFWPYDSLSDIYNEKVQPEFGIIPSKWQFDLPNWKFYYAETRDVVPPDFALANCQEGAWEDITLPTCWQTNGFGLPSSLVYDSGLQPKQDSIGRRLQNRLSHLAGSDEMDDVGVYRCFVTLPADYLERAIYFTCSGIRGRFEIFVNGQPVCESAAVYSHTKFLLSPYLLPGDNLLTILVYRLNQNKRGRIHEEGGSFGLAGIFRMPSIVAESLIEIESLQISTQWAPMGSPAMEEEVLELIAPTSSALEEGEEGVEVEVEPETTQVEPDPLLASQRRDSRLHVRIGIKNHVDLPVGIFISCKLYEVRPEYDLYHLPIHPFSQGQDVAYNLKPDEAVFLENEYYASRVLPWSDQTPCLYDLIITLTDTQERIICVKKQRFGFRNVEVLAKVFHINDVALPLRAVRYFSFDPQGGLSVPKERFLQDIQLIKQAHLNTVIIAYIPADPLFYLMCDHYGLYVISQAPPKQMLENAFSLAAHPSLVFWSFPPGKYDDSKLWELKQRMLEWDRSRLFYADADQTGKLSDIPALPSEAGVLFGEWSDICMDQQWRLAHMKVRKQPPIFASEAIKRREESIKSYKWLHQADLSEYHDAQHVPIAQGLVSADRDPHPLYYEVKRQCETVKIFPGDDTVGQLYLQNLHPLGSTPELIIYWQLLVGGVHLRGGYGEPGVIMPGTKAELRFPVDAATFITSKWLEEEPEAEAVLARALSRELILDIRICMLEDTSYAAAGHELAFYQQVLVENVFVGSSEQGGDFFSASNMLAPVEQANTSVAAFKKQVVAGGQPLKIVASPTLLTVSQKAVAFSFSRNSGGMKDLSLLGGQLLAGSLQPSFYRAATNADRSDQSFTLSATIFSKETDWKSIQEAMSYKSFFYEMRGEIFSLLVQYQSPAFKGKVMLEYQILPNGTLKISMAFTPKYDLWRAGVRLPLPKSMRFFSWYGRGLQEAYPDRREASRLGLYEAFPEQLYHEYSRPQENGAHVDTRCLLVTDGQGRGLKISAESQESFSFTAAIYSPEALDECLHQEQLRPRDSYELFLDFYQRGIERTGMETGQFVKNRLYRGTFIFEPWLGE